MVDAPRPFLVPLNTYAFVVLGLWAGSTAAAELSPLELRLVHDGKSVHLALPDGGNLKAREAIEIEGWDALAPLMRALRADPAADTLLAELRRWGKTQDRVLTVGEMRQSWEQGLDALSYARVQYRSSVQTAEQAGVWARAELPPSADTLTLHTALHSRAIDDGVEDVEFEFEWRSAPAPGEDASARGRYWAADGAVAFRAELRAATVALVDLFEAGRHDALPVGGPIRGRLAGSKTIFKLVRVDGDRVLLIDDDEKFYAVPNTQWTVNP